MLFKFKQKKITIDFFTDNYAIYDLFKIEKTIKNKPDWLSNDLPIRGCSGFTDFLNKSYTVRLWSDILIEKDDNGDIQTSASSNDLVITSNPPSERGNFLDPYNYQHIKFLVPWYSAASESIPCAFYPATWHNERYINYLGHLPSIVDLYYSKSFMMHYIINKHNMELNKENVIGVGEALQYFIPITERKVEINSHYDPDKVSKLKTYQPQLFSLRDKCYFRLKKIIKNNDKNKL